MHGICYGRVMLGTCMSMLSLPSPRVAANIARMKISCVTAPTLITPLRVYLSAAWVTTFKCGAVRV